MANDNWIIGGEEDCPADVSRVVDGLRDTGYEFTTAIADIVDNSIAAEASLVSIHLQRDPAGELIVMIIDNGVGMDADELRNAMRYGSKAQENPSSLSKFGLGLKTASTSFCKSLSVVSRGTGDATVRKATWDLDYIAKRNSWALLTPQPTDDEIALLDEIAQGNSGTLVLWEKIDRLFKTYSSQSSATRAFNRAISDLRFHMGATYQRFIENGLEIRVNNESVRPWDPFCTTEADTEVVDGGGPLTIELPDGSEVPLTLEAYIIPRKDSFSSPEASKEARVSNDYQGFYVYREQRLIYYGKWLGMFSNEPHFSLARVKIDFDYRLDDVLNIDIKKSTINMSEELFDYIKNSFVPAPRRAAEDRYRKGKSKKISDDSRDAHSSANTSIDGKAAAINNSTIEITNPQTGEVSVTNSSGTFQHKLTIRTSGTISYPRVCPADGIEDGLLWRPVVSDGKTAVEINTNHPFYQKVYYPVLDQEVMVTGMDSLLWALAEAELAVLDQETIEQYEEMRFIVSKNLRRLLRDLPDPDVKDE